MTDTTADGESLIPKITREDEAAGSGDLVRENVERLKALFPQIVTDGKVDFDVLRQLLGDEVEEGEERYGLNWKGKRRARAFAMTPSLGTLRPAPEDSVDWDTTQNLMIEGDNLEVLKLLRRSYAGKVKLIYIDPPYNTGNDFVYPDDFGNSIQNYLSLTGQKNDLGAAATSKREARGRLHTEWLNMIAPRMSLARELLAEDGVICVSIDDREIYSLKDVLDQEFGEENYVGTIVRATGTTTGQDSGGLGSSFDYVLCYSRTDDYVIHGLPLDEGDQARFTGTDSRGNFSILQLRKTGNADRREDRPSMYYEVKAPDGSPVFPVGPTGYDSRWRFGREKYEDAMKNDLIVWKESDDGWKPYVKYYLEGRTKKPSPLFDDISGNKKASIEVKELIGEGGFSNPKPTELISRLATIFADRESVIMDFFAGSGTTGHAVMARNAEDGGSRRYLLVQLPEPLDPEKREQAIPASICAKLGKPLNIAELTKERLRRAGQKIRAEHPDAKIDTGFRVYKLATSNLKPWQPDPDNLEASILDAVDNVLPDRTEHDLLVELLLKTGIDLTMPEDRRTIAGQTVHALGGGALMVCLGDVGPDDAETLGQGMADWLDELDPTQTTTYFKDVGLGTDNNRSATKANLAAILRQRHGDRIAKIASI